MIDEDIKKLIKKIEDELKKDDRFYSNGDNQYREQIKKIYQESKYNKKPIDLTGIYNMVNNIHLKNIAKLSNKIKIIRNNFNKITNLPERNSIANEPKAEELLLPQKKILDESPEKQSLNYQDVNNQLDILQRTVQECYDTLNRIIG